MVYFDPTTWIQINFFAFRDKLAEVCNNNFRN
jgi:hypothetical protein